MASLDSTKICFICEKSYKESESIVHVTAKGRTTLLEASRKRQDGKAEYVENHDTIVVHIDCRKWYTCKRDIEVAAARILSEKTKVS